LFQNRDTQLLGQILEFLIQFLRLQVGNPTKTSKSTTTPKTGGSSSDYPIIMKWLTYQLFP
jgi:hypothetical protein